MHEGSHEDMHHTFMERPSFSPVRHIVSIYTSLQKEGTPNFLRSKYRSPSSRLASCHPCTRHLFSNASTVDRLLPIFSRSSSESWRRYRGAGSWMRRCSCAGPFLAILHRHLAKPDTTVGDPLSPPLVPLLCHLLFNVEPPYHPDRPRRVTTIHDLGKHELSQVQWLRRMNIYMRCRLYGCREWRSPRKHDNPNNAPRLTAPTIDWRLPIPIRRPRDPAP